MSRTAHLSKVNKTIAGVMVALALIGGAVTILYVAHRHPQIKHQTTASSVITSSIVYEGQNGKSALDLLKTHAKVVTKSSSLGDYVVSINGNDGGGKKYWLFYVNGKEAQVGAAAYITKTGDKIEWKLQ